MINNKSTERHWIASCSVAFVLFVSSGYIADALGGDDDVRNATSSARYIPAYASKVSADWARWLREADGVIRVTGDRASAKTNATDILYEALRAGLDPELIFALVEVQSQFDQHATSIKGGAGLLMLLPDLHERLGNKENTLYLGKYNLRLGCSVLKQYIEINGGNVELATTSFLKRATATDASSDVLWRIYKARKKSMRLFNPLTN